MESKELMEKGLPKIWNMKEPTLNSPGSSKPIESQDQRKERIEKLLLGIPYALKSAGFPKKFINQEFKAPFGIEYVDKGLCLTGGTGIGKTMAFSLMVRDWLVDKINNSESGESLESIYKKSNGIYRDTYGFYSPWLFISYPEFIMRLQDSYKHEKGEKTALELLESISKMKYLIIDDLGAEKPTEYVRQATYYIINHREMHELPTFITTNFSLDYLNDNIDPRISSRISGMCEIIKMEGKDRRVSK